MKLTYHELPFGLMKGKITVTGYTTDGECMIWEIEALDVDVEASTEYGDEVVDGMGRIITRRPDHTRLVLTCSPVTVTMRATSPPEQDPELPDAVGKKRRPVRINQGVHDAGSNPVPEGSDRD